MIMHTEFDGRGRLVTTPFGQLDAAGGAIFAEHVATLPHGPDVVDCRFVDFLDAGGLRQFAALHRGHRLSVVPSDSTYRLFDLCGFDRVLDLEPPTGGPYLEHAKFGVAIYDERLRYYYVNEALARINRRPPASHIGRTVSQVLQPDVDEISGLARDALGSGHPVSRLVLTRIDGKTESWRCTYRPVRYSTRSWVVATVLPFPEEDQDSAAAQLVFGSHVN